MDQQQITFPCVRKHTFLDQKYILTLTSTKLELQQAGKEPKYVVVLLLNVRIKWHLNQAKLLEAFSIDWKKKVKLFHASHNDLMQLKNKIKNQVFFSSIHELYKPLSQVGEEDDQEFYISQDRVTEFTYMVKCIQKYEYRKNIDSIYSEIECLSQVDCPQVQKLEEIYKGDNSLYLVMENLEGPTLQQVTNSVKLDSGQIKLIMSQLLSGLEYIHNKNIMHRDIKLTTIAFSGKNNINELKIIDFGLATKTNKSKFLYNQCGTPGYLAPEIFQDVFTEKCDIFSAGCVMYKLLTNRELYQGRSREEILKLNKCSQINMQHLQMFKLTMDESDLLSNLLQSKVELRFSASEALNHKYFQSLSPGQSKKMAFQKSKQQPNDKPVWQTTNFAMVSTDTVPNQIQEEIQEQQKMPEFKVLKNATSPGSKQYSLLYQRSHNLRSNSLQQFRSRQTMNMKGIQ